MKEYGVYDMNDNEKLVALGDINEIIKVLGFAKRTIFNCAQKQTLLKKRYQIVIMDEDDEK